MPRNFPDWIEGYIEYSSTSEAPEEFHRWTAISVLAGALQRKVWIDQKYFQWTPNFYIVFVAPPGIVSKSTTANIGMNLLRELSNISFGPNAVTWQSLVQTLAQSTCSFEHLDALYPMSPITIVSSEFGTLLNPNDREMVDVLVDLWDGQVGTFEKKTKTAGNDVIVNPWINILACTTPSWIAGNFPEYMIGGGFTSRTIFVYAEEKRRLVAYPSGIVPPEFEALRLQLIQDLEHISTQLVGEMELSPAAIRWGEEWYERHYEKHKADTANDRFSGYIARKQTHIHKTAIVLQASRTDSMIIEPHTLEAAETLVTSTEGNMEKVFERIASAEARGAISVRNLLQKHKRMPWKNAHRSLFTQLGSDQFRAAVESCVEAGYLRVKNTSGVKFIELVQEEENGH